ncbi:MAG: molybdate ABC transporter substrate-binding protein [Actinomycetota bacterium]|nr:molybdate ABC transporter substrate-binding protein [Actinomycetota bacterium]
MFLAGSLTNVFLQLSKQFEADNPGVIVNFSSTVSADIAKQIVGGAPADVFAPAGNTAMKTLTDAMKADGLPVIFATNVLEIATAPGNPKGIVSFADLAEPGVRVSVCDPTAACGMETVKVEQAAGVILRPVSEKTSLDSVLSQVTTGQADAGLVYVTDVVAATSTVQGVMFPESSTAVTDYPIAVIKGASEPDLAKRFVQLVTGKTGQTMLKAAGFGTKAP